MTRAEAVEAANLARAQDDIRDTLKAIAGAEEVGSGDILDLDIFDETGVSLGCTIQLPELMLSVLLNHAITLIEDRLGELGVKP